MTLYNLDSTLVLFFLDLRNAAKLLRTCTVTCYFHFHFQGDLVACGVLSGNRNFEGRIHPLTRANYLASPPLVIAYALAGTVLIDFEKDPLGKWG